MFSGEVPHGAYQGERNAAERAGAGTGFGENGGSAEGSKRIYLLNLSHTDPSSFSRALQKYLRDVGEEKNAAGIKLRERYKCKDRKPWYGVPIIQNGELFFSNVMINFPESV